MVGQDDSVLAWLRPSDSIQTPLHNFECHLGSVGFIGHQPADSLDDFFLNRQPVGVEQLWKASPGDSRPDNRLASLT